MICKKCNSEFLEKYSKYSNEDFCSKKCARSYSTMEKREEINKNVSEKLTGFKHSQQMKNKIIISNMNRDSSCKNKISNKMIDFYKTEKGETCKKNLSKRMTERVVSNETRLKIGEKSRKRCENLEVRIFMGEIGKFNSPWGNSGHTENNRFYQSGFEKKCFDFLEDHNVEFDEHKLLPDSSRISDIYLNKFDIWIELDGLGREAKKEYLISKFGSNFIDSWNLKIEEYKYKKLTFEVFTTFNDFKIYIKNYYK